MFHQSSAPITFDERFGNPDLELERAVHTGFGAEWSFAPHWRADLELYRIGRDNLVAANEVDKFANTREVPSDRLVPHASERVPHPTTVFRHSSSIGHALAGPLTVLGFVDELTLVAVSGTGS